VPGPIRSQYRKRDANNLLADGRNPDAPGHQHHHDPRLRRRWELRLALGYRDRTPVSPSFLTATPPNIAKPLTTSRLISKPSSGEGLMGVVRVSAQHRNAVDQDAPRGGYPDLYAAEQRVGVDHSLTHLHAGLAQIDLTSAKRRRTLPAPKVGVVALELAPSENGKLVQHAGGSGGLRLGGSLDRSPNQQQPGHDQRNRPQGR